MNDATAAQIRSWSSVCNKYGFSDEYFIFKEFLKYWNCFKSKNGKNPTMKDIKNQFLKGYVCLEKSVK